MPARPRRLPPSAALTLAVIAACSPACRRKSTDTPKERPAPSASIRSTLTAHPEVVTVAVLTRQGGRLDWSPDGRRIAFDRPLQDHCTDLFVMSADGTSETCLTCDHQKLGLPSGHKGNPAWHPTDDWIVFQAEQDSASTPCSHRSSPSRGVANELWAVRVDGSSAVRLQTLDRARPLGVLAPRFDPKGQRLLWSQMVRETDQDAGSFSPGEWNLRVAPFTVENARVALGPAQELTPGRPAFYHAQDFTPDGSAIFFSGNLDDGQTFQGLDIAVFDPAARTIARRITFTPKEADRIARATPAGRVLFSSTRGLPNEVRNQSSDLWIAEPDGSSWQLTRFNAALWELKPPGLPLRTSASDAEFSPDGSQLAAFIASDESRNAGMIVTLRFSAPL